MKRKTTPGDMSRRDGKPLAHLDLRDLMPLPPPLSDPGRDRPWKQLAQHTREICGCILDDTCAVNLPRPRTEQERVSFAICCPIMICGGKPDCCMAGWSN